ncbi:hypothetical protein A3860_17155 [Niastella vici]|uniref:Outer membrane protein beta-barrel domain-containing protein n=1 Tax=Niastella vici TaxID=1703345 RepID=A0A1V9G452_9BACT|nr:hypothetical protein [Niastella vici]OQP65393.1 hypothetical protein A3860_17155 [Niastella vici]
MKKFNLTLLVLIIGLSGFAQYKKANYFEKEGRTYSIGTRFYSLGDGRGTPMGYTFAVASDKVGKQFFSGYEFQYIPSYKFEFGTTDYYGAKVTTQGKTKGQLFYTMNLGYHLLENNEDRKIKPYIIASLNGRLFGGVKETNGDGGDARIVPETQLSFGIGGGAGCVFYVTSWLGLYGESGYTYQFNISQEGSGDNVYWLFPRHTYISAGLRFRVAGN